MWQAGHAQLEGILESMHFNFLIFQKSVLCLLSAHLKRCLFLKQVAKVWSLKIIISVNNHMSRVVVQSRVKGIYDYHLYSVFQKDLIYKHLISQCVSHFELQVNSTKIINKLNSFQTQGCFLNSVFLCCVAKICSSYFLSPYVSGELVKLLWILELAFHNLKHNLVLALLGNSPDSSMVVQTCKPGTLQPEARGL